MRNIASFAIRGLHGSIDVTVPFVDGRVVLVGVNGLGKTTIVSMLYYTLTKQWQKLLEYEFDSVTLVVENDSISIERDLLAFPELAWQQSLLESLPASAVDRLRMSPDFNNLVRLYIGGRVSREDVTRVARKVDLPVSFIERTMFAYHQSPSKKQRKTSKALQDIEDHIGALKTQVLYLPTYRRIEQDLKSLFPEFEGDFKKAVRARVGKDARAGYVELVEFGMEDVDARVSAKVAALKEGSRVELNNLAGGYLRDVIRGEAREWSQEKINKLPDHEVRLILARVEEKQLDEQDKGKVFEVINRIRNRMPLDSDQDLLAHFFSKLVSIHETQQAAEVPLRQFIDVCNRYLEAKNFVFDDVAYTLTLERVMNFDRMRLCYADDAAQALPDRCFR